MVAQQPVNDIIFCNEERCASNCGAALGVCEQGILVCDAVSGDVADVVYTTDSGATWTNTAAQPFIINESIISATCIRKDKNVTRWIVVRGAGASGVLEIAYSDDSGATWVNVDVEASGTRYAADSGALFALDYRHIWLVSTEGYIFFSSDGGASWTPQETDAGITTGSYFAVHFADENVGYAVAAAGIVAKTDDGGATWVATTVVTGTPDILCVYVWDEDNVIIGDDEGTIWRSYDAGVTWSSLWSEGSSINDITFNNNGVGFAIDDEDLYRTRNGGADWEDVSDLAAATEYNAVWMCDNNKAFVVGEATALGVVFEVTGY